jgi:hypothetical protein
VKGSPGDRTKTGFDWIEIGGTRYEHDIVIHADGSILKRHKKFSKSLRGEYGRTPLSAEKLAFIDEEHPEAVYVGTGRYGDLPLTLDLQMPCSASTGRL